MLIHDRKLDSFTFAIRRNPPYLKKDLLAGSSVVKLHLEHDVSRVLGQRRSFAAASTADEELCNSGVPIFEPLHLVGLRLVIACLANSRHAVGGLPEAVVIPVELFLTPSDFIHVSFHWSM